MDSNVNLESLSGALAFMGGCAVLLLLALVAAPALLKRKHRCLRVALAAGHGALCVYLWVMLAFSFAGRERGPARGEEKDFCSPFARISRIVSISGGASDSVLLQGSALPFVRSQ
jgi:hypothetical protein